jgi:hypothetical protein
MRFLAFPRWQPLLGFLRVLCVLCGSVLSCFSLDREAFTFTNYDLNLQIEPEQHRLGVRGKITLRNDSPTPQKIAVLQISSSLDWRTIKLSGSDGGKPVQFVTQPYTSDVDHTGALSEAIVTLPQPVAPKATVELEIGYEGVIVLDATRLTRIGTPEDEAKSSDWDQISTDFTGVRGAGYVAWYPIAAEAANLSEGSLFEVLGRWKAREAASRMKVALQDPTFLTGDAPSILLCSGRSTEGMTREGTAKFPLAQCTYDNIAHSAPTFGIAKFGVINRPSITVYNLPSHAVAGESYADASEKIVPLITDWFGVPREKAITADLPDPNAAPFESDALLFTPLANTDAKLARIAAAHQLTHAAFSSPRPWINEGLAHFAQALYLEQQKGRQAAVDYMGFHRSAFLDTEKRTGLPRSDDETTHSLVNTINEELYRSKSMCVWWMLRDMVGDAALKKALAAYHAEQDNDPSYMPHLLAAQTQRNLEWFFDDWVYRDRGLPDFKVEAAFVRKATEATFIVTVTIDNLGTAGAEVPVSVKFAGGEVTKRLEVRARNKATTRIEVPSPPQEVVVNDGSVPESDVTNNTFKMDTPAEAK